MLPRPLIRAACLSGVFEALEAAGVTADDIHRATGLAPSDVIDPARWLPLLKVATLFRRTAGWLDSETAGLELGAAVDPKDLGLLIYLVYSAPTLRAGIASLNHYIRVLADGADVDLEVSESGAAVTFAISVPDIVERHQLVEWVAAAALNGMREILGPRWAPLEIHFEHAAPADLGPYETLFAAPVLFDQPHNAFVVDGAQLNQPLRSSDSRLHAILETQADATLATRPQDDGIIELLRGYIVRSLSREYPTIQGAARELGVSARTLQRRLRETGTDYTGLIDETRCNLAHAYLDEMGLTLKEIAHLLGYSQPSAFNRAWRRWTGSTPREYRNRESR